MQHNEKIILITFSQIKEYISIIRTILQNTCFQFDDKDEERWHSKLEKLHSVTCMMYVHCQNCNECDIRVEKERKKYTTRI